MERCNVDSGFPVSYYTGAGFALAFFCKCHLGGCDELKIDKATKATFCKPDTDKFCRAASKVMAMLYTYSPNANTCKLTDPFFKFYTDLGKSCET